MKTLENRLYNPTARKLIIKMAEVAQAYQEPYDSMDKKAQEHNLPLEQKWNIYFELLEELVD